MGHGSGSGGFDVTAALGNFTAAPTPTTATLVDVLLLRITGSSLISAGAMNPQSLSFSDADIGNGTIRTARTTTPVASLISTAIGNLQLSVSVLRLGLGSTTAVTNALKALVTPLGPVLDTTLIGLLDVLGISLGEADVQVYGVRCSKSVLVG